ncbi:putative RNA-directed DNA polymerase from mobile element jockey-like [Apostichopus japonicus]|uniref:Putative RNA-directed DNA polymerase from mobile element jockey-like n=1 Tax=Stichopus japonicus TaxID=307972 RepID=A0A2G8KHY1_STIJA|nr:putative RNA-directed DNA polymerase from mobile element jockey-like [Apostichopus japonicus]
MSDHDTVLCTLKCFRPYDRQPRRRILLYSKGNYDAMRHETRAFTQNYFNGLQNKRDIESNWKLIKSFLDSTVKRNIPSKMSSGRKSLPWVSTHIQRLIRRRDRLHSLYKRTRKTNIYDKWVEMRSRIKKEIRASHTNFVNGILGDVKTDCKPFWKYINGKRKDKHCIPPLQTKDKIVFSDIDKAEAFNEQFSSVFTRNTPDEIPLQSPLCVRMDDIVSWSGEAAAGFENFKGCGAR